MLQFTFYPCQSSIGNRNSVFLGTMGSFWANGGNSQGINFRLSDKSPEDHDLLLSDRAEAIEPQTIIRSGRYRNKA